MPSLQRDEVDIDIEAMLDWLGVQNLEWRGRKLWYSCPFAGHKNLDRKQSASFEKLHADCWGWVFNCFGCGSHGDVVDFLVVHEGIDSGKRINPRGKAREWLRGQYGTGWVDPGNTLSAEIEELLSQRPAEAKRPLVQIPEEILEGWAVDWEGAWNEYIGPDADQLPEALTYLFRRGFFPSTLIKWEIGYDPISETLSIPYRDVQHRGALVGFKGRAWWADARPKYRSLGNKEGREDRYTFDTAQVSRLLFGAWKIGCGGGRLIVCEGELNTIAMSQYGHDLVVGISGQFLSDEQARQILSIADEVVLLFDEEDKAIQAADKLEHAVPVWIVPERDSDPADSSREEVAVWLSGAKLPFELVDFTA